MDGGEDLARLVAEDVGVGAIAGEQQVQHLQSAGLQARRERRDERGPGRAEVLCGGACSHSRREVARIRTGIEAEMLSRLKRLGLLEEQLEDRLVAAMRAAGQSVRDPVALLQVRSRIEDDRDPRVQQPPRVGFAAGREADPGGLLDAWIPVVLDAGADLEQRNRISYALACSAHRCDETVFELLFEEPEPFEPGQHFGFDAGAYARYLAAAVRAGASAEDFGPAWTSFVASFPTRLETGGLQMLDLLFAGYGAYSHIFGHEPREILAAVHGYVREMAAA